MKHIHRFIVEPPNGTEELTGNCACGVKRTWPAVPEESWNGAKDIAAARKRGAAHLVKANRRRR